jgi:ribosomal protein S18 acetylase RimI-like enzyme
MLDGSTPLPVLRAYLVALYTAFGEHRPITVELDEATCLQQALVSGRTQIGIALNESGAVVACANLVGIGRVGGIAGPAAELSGVWTAPQNRGRGLARTVAGRLLRQFFRTGGRLVWLAADDRLAAGLYTGLGFRSIGRLLRYSHDSP